MQEISDILSPGKKLSTDGAFCRRGAWRTLGRRGVAIRFPAEKPGKLALLRANPQPLSYSPKVLLSAMPCRKENGLSRRFAPRDDRGGRPCEPVQDGNRGAPVRPGEGDAAE